MITMTGTGDGAPVEMAEVIELAKPYVDKFLATSMAAFTDMMDGAANEHEGGTVAVTAAWFAATLMTVDILGIIGLVLRATAVADDIPIPDDTRMWSQRAMQAYLTWLSRGDPNRPFTVSDALRAARRSDLN